MDTLATPRFGTVAYFVERLREISAGDDSYEAFLHVEAVALDKIVRAADPQGDTDTDRLAEVRNVIAALHLIRADRQARLGR